MTRKKPNLPPGVAYGYVRVSHRKQEISGLSLEAQESKIRAYASYRSLSLVEPLFVDSAVSASKTRLGARPAGSRLFKALRPGDHVIVAKIDRAWRNASDALGIVDSWLGMGVTLHLLDIQVDTSTPLGKVFFTILAAFAEWEASQISERTIAGLEQARLRGSLTVDPPMGFSREGGVLTPSFPALTSAAGLVALATAAVPRPLRAGLLGAHGLHTSTGLPFTEARVKQSTELVLPHRDVILQALAAAGLNVAADASTPATLTYRDDHGHPVFPAASWRPVCAGEGSTPPSL